MKRSDKKGSHTALEKNAVADISGNIITVDFSKVKKRVPLHRTSKKTPLWLEGPSQGQGPDRPAP